MLSLEQRTTILKLYEPCKGNTYEAARRFEPIYGFVVSPTTVRSHWKKEGLKANPQGISGQKVGKDIRKMIKQYYQFKGRPYMASKHGGLGLSYPTYRAIWEEAGLEIKSKDKNRDKHFLCGR